MKCTFEMGSVAMIYEYMPSFVKVASGIQKLWGIHKHTDRMEIA
jgi:hypothetical protein